MDLQANKERLKVMEYYINEGDIVKSANGCYVCELGRLVTKGRCNSWDAARFLEKLCAMSGVKVNEVCSASRRRKYAEVRQIFCYICKVVKDLPEVEIAFHISRDRSLVFAAVKRCSELMSVDKHFKQRVEDVILQV